MKKPQMLNSGELESSPESSLDSSNSMFSRKSDNFQDKNMFEFKRSDLNTTATTTTKISTSEIQKSRQNPFNMRRDDRRCLLLRLSTLLLISLMMISLHQIFPQSNLLVIEANAQASLLNSLYLSSASSSPSPAPSMVAAPQQPSSGAPPTTITITTTPTTTLSTTSNLSSQKPAVSQPEAIAITKRDLATSSMTITTTTTTGLSGSSAQRSRQQNVCQVNEGESVAIVEIEESRGSDMSRSTNPPELPISGSPSDIELKIESETHKYFTIHNKRLKLTRPLDRDAVLKENSTKEIAQQPVSSIYLQISCQDKRQNSADHSNSVWPRKVIIPVLVKVLDLNDNAPKFSQPIYTVRVDELAPVNSVLVDSIQAIDLDSANNGQIEYSLMGASEPLPVGPKRQNTLQRHAHLPRLVQRAQPTEQSVVSVTTTTSPTIDTPVRLTTMPTTTTTTTTERVEETTRKSLQETRLPSSSVSPATLSSRSSSSNPSINLDSEPIVNGPMEDGEEEEESDEALLAALGNGNSTQSSPSDDSGELVGSDAMVLMLQPSPSRSSGDKSRRRRRKRRSSLPTTLADSAAPNWTNLLNSATVSSEDSGVSSANLQELISPSSFRQQADGDASEFFALELAPNSNKPIIKLKKPLDYESRRVHVINVQATDKAFAVADRKSSVAKVIIRVLDNDDQGPAFVLDQTGCATGSIPMQTTSSPNLMLMSRRQGDLLESGLVSGNAGASPSSSGDHHLPKGFKVTEENFDFGDMSGGEGSDGLIDSSDQFAVRPKRYPFEGSLMGAPNGQGLSNANPTTSTKKVPDYSCLPTGSNWQTGNGGQAEYFASVMSGESDYLLRVVPQQIKARDRDELNAPIRYSFVNGTPANYSHFFQIHPLEATIKQILPIDRSQVDKFVIFVQAQEQTSVNKYFSVAKLTIEVLASDRNPPMLIPNSYAGFVEENSPLGSNVFISPNKSSSKSQFMKISVFEDDGSSEEISSSINRASGFQQGAGQLYEFETTSEAFKVNKDGFVYVNKWPLDRDPPNQSIHMFQVTARQLGLASSRSISSPVSINVTLLDLNDNPPVLLNSSLAPIYMPASNRPNSIKSLGFIRAHDLDQPENAKMRFSIHHVSNNGRERFRINADSGELEALGKFNAHEQFSLTVQVSDELSRWAQGILEVFVVPGPNSGGPQFIISGQDLLHNGAIMEGGDNSRGYSVELNEGVAPHSAILQVFAADPENDPISYSIIDGNINSDFYINSKTGVIHVANKLDREEVSAYHLMVQARDTGGLATNRPVLITISDNNDENPTFERAQYVFSIPEGLANVTLGYLKAIDNDLAENGEVNYQLADTENNLFSINPQTGELRLMEKLDFEQAKHHSLIVTARDRGEKPRSTTCNVLIHVQDVQDEAPFFERYHLEVRVRENQPHFRLAQIQAKDLDSSPQITYVIKSGDASLFSVDPLTGVISTISGLDYEESQRYTIFIGTQEGGELAGDGTDLIALSEKLSSQQLDKSPICRIDILVQDVNDNAPKFANQPLPVRIQDSAQLGTILIKLQAEDRDGSDANNQVRYELVTADNMARFAPVSPQADSSSDSTSNQQILDNQFTSDKCAQSFMVDPASGSVGVKSDLKRDTESECQLIVRAYDLNQSRETQLSSSTQLTVYIDHLVEISPASAIGFADSSYTIELDENLPSNSLVKILPVINKPKASFPLSCELSAGNELGRFFVLTNEQRDCELRTRDPFLDYEIKPKYSLTIKLNTIGSGIGGQSKILTIVNINIIDQNDNRPVFQQVARYGHLTGGRYLAAMASDAPSESQLIQLKAVDLDSPQANGLISYELLNDSFDLESRFKINSFDGTIRSSKPMEDIPSTRLPLRLRVLARDNPEVGPALENVAEVLVNLIDDRNRIALVIKDSPTGRVLESKEEILGAIQERTGLLAGVEKVESLKVFRNNSLEPDVGGTDFWFYLIEPGTFRIVPSEDQRLKVALFDYRGQNSLLDVINQSHNLNAIKVRLPYNLIMGRSAASSSSLGSTLSRSLGANGQMFATFLIIIALFIALTSTIVVIYQCGFWSSYSSAAELASRNQVFQSLASEKLYHPSNAYFNQCPPPSNIGIGNGNTNTLFSSSKGPSPSELPANDPYCYNANVNLNRNLNFSPFVEQQNTNEQSLMPQLVSQRKEQANNNNNNNDYNNSKEYETQMLKMSVLFDDTNSVDEQNLNSTIQMNHQQQFY